MSQNQAQIDAVEHLLLTFLRRSETDKIVDMIFEDANSSIFGSDGPPGTTEKTEAASYLQHLKLKLKSS